MKIGIIGAMQIEVDNLKKHMTDTKEAQISGVTFTQGQVEGVEVVAAVCGVGKVFAAICTEAMILKYDVDCVMLWEIRLGFCLDWTKSICRQMRN